jgi:hypothetical protein
MLVLKDIANVNTWNAPWTLDCYCEFEAKPEMHKVLGKLGEEQMKRITRAGFKFDDEEEPIGMQEERPPKKQ